MALFETGKTYSFKTIAPITLNSTYTGVTLKAILTYDIAKMYSDVVNTHVKVQEEVGRKIPGLDTSIFYLFENKDGEKVVLSELWIEPTSIQIVTSLSIRVIVNEVDETDKYVIESLLKQAGYTNLTVELLVISDQ